jgi:hypothetical protein
MNWLHHPKAYDSKTKPTTEVSALICNQQLLRAFMNISLWLFDLAVSSEQHLALCQAKKGHATLQLGVHLTFSRNR